MNLDIIQSEAIDKLSRLNAGALFMHMGTGKTKVAMDLIQTRTIDCVIWIAPASLINNYNYRLEVDRWNNGVCIKFYTVEGVSQSDSKYLEMRNFAENNCVFCVVDESITIKNTDAGRTKRILDMWNLFDYRLILNGTPLSKGLIDLYSQIKFIHPDILSMSEAQFAHNFLEFKRDGYKPWKRWSRPANEEALIETIRPYIFHADLDIPVSLNEFDEDFRLSNYEAFEYEDFKRNYIKKHMQQDAGSFLAIWQAFQHKYTISSSKINRLKKLVSEILERGEKVAVYVKFIDEVNCLKEILDCAVLSGQEKSGDFKNDKNILISTYGTGSMGLNMQYCNNAIFFTQTFDYKDKIHAIHRYYRTGQESPVNIYNFWVKTGLENIIRGSLEKKQSTANNVKKFIKNKGVCAL